MCEGPHRVGNREQLLHRSPIELTDAQDMATGESHDMHSIVDLSAIAPRGRPAKGPADANAKDCPAPH